MATAAKEAQVEELRKSFTDAKVAVFANTTGVTVEQVTALRVTLRSSDAKLKVIKNTLARRAISETDVADASQFFKGPVTVAFGFGDDISAPAKALIEFSKENEDNMTILGGFVEGIVVGPAEVKVLANMPPKPVVQGMLLGLLQAPARNMVCVMQNSVKKALHLFAARAESLGAEGGE